MGRVIRIDDMVRAERAKHHDDDLVVLQALVTRLDRMQGVLLATLQPVEVVDSPAGAGRGGQAW
ncbi:hypothetical protein ACFXKC_14965 [Streptomyces sp. NPDC059340]|uniref:hypothetical protein n=1 Tax=Streptomyces sp. NPDC059340 TaxID=3346806 RepID=UPI00367456A7